MHCLILFSQQLFEVGAFTHTHFTHEAAKAESSYVTFLKSACKTQVSHPGPCDPVVCTLALCWSPQPFLIARLEAKHSFQYARPGVHVSVPHHGLRLCQGTEMW